MKIDSMQFGFMLVMGTTDANLHSPSAAREILGEE